jgi:hypothetical protein
MPVKVRPLIKKRAGDARAAGLDLPLGLQLLLQETSLAGESLAPPNAGVRDATRRPKQIM